MAVQGDAWRWGPENDRRSRAVGQKGAGRHHDESLVLEVDGGVGEFLDAVDLFWFHQPAFREPLQSIKRERSI